MSSDQCMSSIISTENGFALKGTVSFSSVLALRASGESWINTTNLSDCFVDLTELAHEDASLFSLLLGWMRYAKQKNIAMHFVSQSKTFSRMEKLFGLDKVWINS